MPKFYLVRSILLPHYLVNLAELGKAASQILHYRPQPSGIWSVVNLHNSQRDSRQQGILLTIQETPSLVHAHNHPLEFLLNTASLK